MDRSINTHVAADLAAVCWRNLDLDRRRVRLVDVVGRFLKSSNSKTLDLDAFNPFTADPVKTLHPAILV